MEALLQQLTRDFPSVSFAAGEHFRWSPKDRTVTYSLTRKDPHTSLALLHELSHAVLDHHDYQTDFELLQIEAEAWQQAKELARTYGITPDEDHIQDCLDTYRNWLHARSKCPACTQHGVQKNRTTYVCLNCHSEWKVTSERFCRPYRRSLQPK